MSKIEELKDFNLDQYLKVRAEVVQELSQQQTMFCCCGKLATGYHEQSCNKFHEKIDDEVLKRLFKFDLSKTHNEFLLMQQ